MSMSVTIDLYDLALVTVEASGQFSPDVMNDLTRRAAEVATHAVSLRIQHGMYAQLDDIVEHVDPTDGEAGE